MPNEDKKEESIIIKCKDWSSAEDIKKDISEKIYIPISDDNKNKLINLGISKNNEGEYWTKGFVGVVRLKDENKNNIVRNGKEIILKVEPRFDVNINTMLNLLKDDNEIARYLSKNKKIKDNDDTDIDGESNELFHFFYNEQPIKVDNDIANEGSILTAISFINLLEELCKKPLYGKMQKIEENLTGKVKGKILFNKNIRYNISKARNERIYCQYQSYTVDILENQILKAALYKARRFINKYFSKANTGKSSFNQKISFCMKALERVADRPIKAKDCNGLKMGGFYAHYKPVISVAKMVLEQITITSTGDAKVKYTMPYAINMQKLFEFYVRVKIKEELKSSEGIALEDFEKGRQVILDDENSPKPTAYISGKLIPDIVLKYEDGENTKYRVFDVKYKDFSKRYNNRNDRLQILAYGLIYKCEHIGLIFPKLKEEKEEPVKEMKLNINGSEKQVQYDEFIVSTSKDDNDDNIKEILKNIQ